MRMSPGLIPIRQSIRRSCGAPSLRSAVFSRTEFVVPDLCPYHLAGEGKPSKVVASPGPVDRNGQRAMSKAMKSRTKDLLAAIGVSASLFLNTHAATAQSQPPLSSEQIAQIVASPDRSAADRTNDLRRKPEQMLGFIGIRPGIVALDLSAAGGYTTELLARAIGPSGTVYGQSRPRDPSRAPTPPVAPEGNSNPITAPVRRRRRRRARHVHPRSPWPNVRAISEATASQAAPIVARLATVRRSRSARTRGQNASISRP